MAARVRGDSTFAPSRHAAPQEKIDYTDPQVLMFNNMMLLGFNASAMEKKQGVPFGPTMFSNTGATRQCDCVVHFLLSKIFPVEAASEFKSVWPILDRVQQREFKKIACGMLAKLQKSEAIPSQPQIRPTALDTPSGDRFCMLLWAVSNHALAIEFKRRYPAQYASMPQLSSAPELSRVIVPVAIRHEQLLRSKFLKAAERLAHLDTQWAQVGEALGSTYRELRSQFAQLQEQAQAAGLDPLTAAEQDGAEPLELAHIRDWYLRFTADYAGQETARALVLDILNQRATSASLDAAKISAALGDGTDVSGPLDLSLVLDKWSTSLGQLRQELGAHAGRPSPITSVAAQAQALEDVVSKREEILGAVVKLRQEANDALSDATRSLRRKIVNLGTHAATFPPSPSLRLAPSSPSMGDMFSSSRTSPAPVPAADAPSSTPSTLRRAPGRLWPLESGCVAAAGALTPAGMQRLADSVRKAAKREAGVSIPINSHNHSEIGADTEQPQVSLSDASISSSLSGSSPAEPAPFMGTVLTYTGSIFTPPEPAVPLSVPAAPFGSLQDGPAHSAPLPLAHVAKSESTFITTPEHLKKLESLQTGARVSSSASLISSPVFPSSLRKNASPPPPPPKSLAQQGHPATGFQRVATVPSKGPGFSMSSKQRSLSAAAARNTAAFRDKAPSAAVPQEENESYKEDHLAKALAAKRRIALQQMSKNAIADEIADGIVGSGEVFNKNPFEIRKELPRTPEVLPTSANFNPVISSPTVPALSSLASAAKQSPAREPQTTLYTAQSSSGGYDGTQSFVPTQQLPATNAHAQPSPAHQSAAAAYYAALLNPTPPRVAATPIDMASPLLKEFVPAHSASSNHSIPKFAPSPVTFPVSPSRYAGDPFPSPPAARFNLSHGDLKSSSAWGNAQGTPEALTYPDAAQTNAPHSASSASSWLIRRENVQSDVSNLPSPDLAAESSTPWKPSMNNFVFIFLILSYVSSSASSMAASVSLDIANVSFEDEAGIDQNVSQHTPSHESLEAPHRTTYQQDAITHELHAELQPLVFGNSKAKVTDSESPSNLPNFDSKISIHTGSSTPSLSAIKRKARPVAINAKLSPLPVFQLKTTAWGVSANSDADADSVPSTTTSTWTSTSAPSADASDDDADFESAPDHGPSTQPHKAAIVLQKSDLDSGPLFQDPHHSSGTNDRAFGVASPSEQWSALVDSATAKSPVSKFNASWCVPSPTRRRSSVTPSVLHHGVQPSPFNNPSVFANSPHDSPMDTSSRIDEDVTVNMGYYNPANDVSMRTAKDSPFFSACTDMDISADKEPPEAGQLAQFAGVHAVDQYVQFTRADSSSSAASSVFQHDEMHSASSRSEFCGNSNSSAFSDRNSFVAPIAAAVPRMEFLKELLAVRKKASPVTQPPPQFSRSAANGAMASSVLHDAAIKASNFAPSRDVAASKAAAEPSFQDELRKRLSAVKAKTNVGALAIPQPSLASVGPKGESPYVQKSVGELRKQLLNSKAVLGGAGLATASHPCESMK